MPLNHLRGQEFLYEPMEIVLCFEPDPTKARVLYEAKILEPNFTRDAKGRRKAEYLIHFSGWNSSWDRVVPEEYVLKLNYETKAMQKKLADTARCIKNNKKRKRKIDDILRNYFGGRIPLDSSSDEESDEDDDEDDDDDDDDDDEEDSSNDDFDDEDFYGDDDEDDEIMFRQQPRAKNGSSKGKRQNGGGQAGCMDGQMDETETETEEEESQEEEEVYSDGLEVKENPDPVELEMPPVLRQHLEDDCYFINKKKKLVKLPAEPNVITLLESHVKNLAINVLCAGAEKLRPREAFLLPEKNIDLCKELVDGLRVIFDFSLGENLLYAAEKTQHTRIMSTFQPLPCSKRESMDPAEQMALVQSPKLRSANRKGSPAHGGERSPKIPRLSPKIKPEGESERSDDESDDDDDDDDKLPSRRMTRHAYAEEIRRFRSEKPIKSCDTTTHVPCEETHAHKRTSTGHRADMSGGRRVSLRSSRHHSGSSQHSSDLTQTLADRVTPPPPLLIPNQISSTAGCHTPTRSKCSTPTLADQADKEGTLNSVLQWKLIPDEVYNGSPTTPSVIYGAQHLIRLFVKLPDILANMPIPDTKLKAIVKHVNMLLEYLADRSEELFPDTTYVDSSEAIGNIKQPMAKR